MRPYPGLTVDDLQASYRNQTRAPLPTDSKVPSWLKRIVTRAAALRRSQRYPGVADMVADLINVPRRRKRWRLAGLSVLLLTAAVVSTMLLTRGTSRRASPCAGSEARIAETWSPAPRAQVVQTIAASAISDAPGQAQRVATVIDSYAERWATMHTDVCAATRIRGEQSEAMLDARMLCLEHRRQELHELLRLLIDGDRQVAQRALQAALALDDSARCEARFATVHAPPEPTEPDRRARLSALKADLAAAKALFHMGQYPRLRLRVDDIAAEAQAIDHPPAIAAARLLEGRTLAKLGGIEASERALFLAWVEAEEFGDDLTKLEALADIIVLLSYQGGDLDSAERWQRVADATLSRAGHPADAAAALARAKGSVAFFQGDHKGAVFHTRRAYELNTEARGEKNLYAALILNDMGTAALFSGRFEDGLTHHRRALAIIEELLGAHHPLAADAINNLGNAYFSQGQLPEARAEYRRATDLWRSFFGADHTKVAIGLSNLGNVSFAEEDFDAAIRLYRRARAVELKLLGPDHPNSVATLLNLGTALHENGRSAQALKPLQRALAIVGDARTEDSARIRFALARALDVTGARARAVPLAQAARSLFVELGARYEDDVQNVEDWLAE